MYDGGGGFVVVNQEDLTYFAGITGEHESATRATEAWLSVAPDEAVREGVKTALFDLYRIPDGAVLDSQEFLTDLRSDPIVRAGGSGILLVALIAALAILALGFSLTLYLGGQARSVEVSVMRAVGISSRQLLIMIGLEYLLIAAIGLAVGTLAGLQISETMLSFLDVTNTGARVVPAFDLSTQWDTVAIAFSALGAAFVIGVLALAGYLVRLPVSRVIRLTR